jgi:galactose oxidase-like protein
MASSSSAAASFAAKRTDLSIDPGSAPFPADPATGKQRSTFSSRLNGGSPALLAFLVAAAALLGGGARAQCPPDACGRWSGPIHLWSMAGNPDCQANYNPSVIEPCNEIAHVTLVPVGPKQGWVHFWRATTIRPQITQIWRPDGSDVFDLIVRMPGCTSAPETCYPGAPPPYPPSCPPLDCGNVFCSGHAYLPDGRLVTGGADALCGWPVPLGAVFGSYESWLFDPNQLTGATPPLPNGWWEPWSQVGPMPERGWYPSLLALPNGDILRAGGTVLGSCPPPGSTYAQQLMILKWSAGVPGPWLVPLDVATGNALMSTTGPTGEAGNYPHLKLLSGPATVPGTPSPPTADVLMIDAGSYANSAADYSWLVSTSRQAHTAPVNMNLQCQVMLNGVPTMVPGRRAEENSVAVAGSTDRYALVGGRIASFGSPAGGANDLAYATGRTEVHDIQVNLSNGPASTWQQSLPSLNFGRVYSNTVILPDGSLLSLGGASTDYQAFSGFAIQPVFTPELLSQGAGFWATMADASARRLYHSVAILLPDGRVLVMGGDFYQFYSNNVNSSALYYDGDAEIFSPPYLFKGARPQISGAPASTTYTSTFSVAVRVPPSSSIGSMVFMRPGSVTHAVDFEQKRVPLAFTVVSTIPLGGGWTYQTFDVTAPHDGNVAPPGYYMLFVLNQVGVPSVAIWVALQ